MELQRFTAEFSAPGFFELETIHAVDLAAAERRAHELAQEPFATWPSIRMRGDMTVSVRPAITVTDSFLDAIRAVRETRGAGSPSLNAAE